VRAGREALLPVQVASAAARWLQFQENAATMEHVL
jgi:hypothetical protein